MGPSASLTRRAGSVLRSLKATMRSTRSFLFSRAAIPLWLLAFAALLEISLHARTLALHHPAVDLDPPFATACRNVTASAAAPRENAVLVMLTRNSELAEARHSLRSVERHFNRWFHYPVVFLNDEPWDPEFVEAMTAEVSGSVSFEVLDPQVWGFPQHVNIEAARASIAAQGARGSYSAQTKAGLESYHHMCRFYSGEFYNLDALRKYKWYWRIEPDIDLTCDLTYDPFTAMAAHGKTYGYAIAIAETVATCPSLFGHAARYKAAHHLPTMDGWRAILSASWLPWPLRSWLAGRSNRDAAGDGWNRCHFWSNFEIADLDFFRSREYQDFFRYLDRQGGFYFERWGDAPVHSLALAMLLEPRRLHYFADLGYRHDWLFRCPGNAPGGQGGDSGVEGEHGWAPEVEGGIGCRCECDPATPRNFPGGCLDRLHAPNRPRVWF